MWTLLLDFTYLNMIPASLVGCVAERPMVSTAPARDVGINALTTARAGSVSLCFKNDKAQTVGRLAPVCEDAPSGLDPANRAAFSLNEGHTETKGYSGGIGLCQLHEDPTIKTPTGNDSLQEYQSINYVREPRRTASHARSSRRLVEDIVISMGGITDGKRLSNRMD